METLITILLILISVMTLIIVLWLNVANQKHRNFKRFLKKGDKVDFYVGEIRNTYTLERHGEIYSELRSEKGNLRKVQTSELLPNFWYNYKLTSK